MPDSDTLLFLLPATPAATDGTGASVAMAAVLQRLGALGRVEAQPDGPLTAALRLLALGEPALAPLLGAGAGVHAPDARYLLAATPVHLAIAGDDVRVVDVATALDIDYVTATMAELNAMFAEDAMQFIAASPDSWFVAAPAPDMHAPPLHAVLGGSLYAHRPTGQDARRWERFGNEVQMLLFARNAAMVAGADGAPPDGVWFWGGGAFPPVASAAPVVTWAAAHDHSGAAHLARGLALAQGRVAGELPADYAALAQHASAVPTLVALPRSTEDALARDWLAPALRALEHHRLQHLIVVGGGAATRSWTAGAPSRWQRLRLRFGLPAHAAPA